MDFVTDLNHRERAELVEMIRSLKDSVGKLEDALVAADDRKLLVEFTLTLLMFSALDKRLRPVIMDAAAVMKGSQAIDEFRGF